MVFKSLWASNNAIRQQQTMNGIRRTDKNYHDCNYIVKSTNTKQTPPPSGKNKKKTDGGGEL